MLPQRIRLMGLRLLMTLYAVGGLLAPAAGFAAIVEIQTARQTAATADFRPGAAGRPAILILHGFLQTRDFGIVRIIADALADQGYTVLSPTLTLGISRRNSSLDCEALHLHDMEGDAREIQQWVAWLRKRGHERIIGIGHSFGGAQLLAWREKYREKDFGLIGVSLVGSSPSSPEAKAALAGKASGRSLAGAGLVHAPLSFCNSYTAPAGSYASYRQWDENRVLDALKRSPAGMDVILGSGDKFLPPDWGRRLARSGAQVHAIEGASHFMDGPQEFDLLDGILGIVKR